MKFSFDKLHNSGIGDQCSTWKKTDSDIVFTLEIKIETSKNSVIRLGFAKKAQGSFFPFCTELKSFLWGRCTWKPPLALIWQNTSITSLWAPYQMDMWGGAKRIRDTFHAASQVNQNVGTNEPNFTFKWNLVVARCGTIPISDFRSTVIARLPIPANTWTASIKHIHLCCCQTRVIRSTQSYAQMSKCSVYCS